MSDDTASTATAIVTVRVPRNGKATLTTNAKQRLARIEGVQSVRVDGVQDIDPQLSATCVTVAVIIRGLQSIETLRNQISDVTAVESVDRVTHRIS